MTIRTHRKRPSTNPTSRVYFVIVPAGKPVPSYDDAVAAGIGRFADDPAFSLIWEGIPAKSYYTIIGLREPMPSPRIGLMARRQPTHPISIKKKLK